MERDGRQAVALLKHGGEKVLAGVLLHVVKAAGPVNAAIDGGEREFAVDNVGDVFAVIPNFEDVGLSELAEIVGLAARGGIQRGAVQDDFPGRLGAGGGGIRFDGNTGKNARAEILKGGVVVVEAVRGHACGILT
jgi:hypothetical protein